MSSLDICCLLMLNVLLISACSQEKPRHHIHNAFEENTQENAASPNDQYTLELQKEVLAIHDEVMPRMDDIMALQIKVKEKLTHLTHTNRAAFGQNLPHAEKQLQMVLADLRKADAAMMQWMRDYSKQIKIKSGRDRQKYLKIEKVKITQVKEQMLKSVENARQVLK